MLDRRRDVQEYYIRTGWLALLMRIQRTDVRLAADMTGVNDS